MRIAVSDCAGGRSPGAHAQPGPPICNPYLRQCADNAVVGATRPRRHPHPGIGIVQTIDCNNPTLLVNGSGNQITALGTCWAVTVQGNGNVVVADNVDQRRHGVRLGSDRAVQERRAVRLDRGRELGMTNHIDRVRRVSCAHLAFAVAVAAASLVLAGCGSESSDSKTPTATAGTSGAQVEVGNTINYGSFGTTADIDCADGKSLNIGGSNNTLTVKGTCANVNIGGADNKVTFERSTKRSASSASTTP